MTGGSVPCQVTRAAGGRCGAGPLALIAAMCVHEHRDEQWMCAAHTGMALFGPAGSVLCEPCRDTPGHPGGRRCPMSGFTITALRLTDIHPAS